MIDYPAGLTCSLVQSPLGVVGAFGAVALASPGQSPFIVGGGRWQVPCGDIGGVAAVPGGLASVIINVVVLLRRPVKSGASTASSQTATRMRAV